MVSEFTDIFVKFSNFMSRGWGFWVPVLSRGEGFCTQSLSRGRVFAPSKSCPGGLSGGMVMDEIDTCVTWLKWHEYYEYSVIHNTEFEFCNCSFWGDMTFWNYPSHTGNKLSNSIARHLKQQDAVKNLAIWLLLFKQRRMQLQPIKRRLFCWTGGQKQWRPPQNSRDFPDYLFCFR